MTMKGPVVARRQLMQRARRQFLAGAGGTDDENAAVGRRDAIDRLAQLRHDAGTSDQRRRQRRHLLELADFALEARGLERAVGDQHQPVGLERLLDEVVGAVLDGGDGGFDIAVAGDHHDRNFGVFGFENVEQLQAVELGALQPDIEKNQVRPPGRDGSQRIVRIAGGARDIAFVLQNASDQIADVGFVVDDENFSGHKRLLG